MNISNANRKKYTPMTGELLETMSAAKALAAVPDDALYALITASVQHVNFTDNATVPSATHGIRINSTDAPFWYTGDLGRLRFIELASGAKVYVQYYK